MNEKKEQPDFTDEDLVEDGMPDLADLDFDQEPEEEDFTEEEGLEVPQSPPPSARQRSNRGTPPNSGRRNTFILIGVTVVITIIGAAWIFLTAPSRQEKRVINANDILPPANKMQQAQQPLKQSYGQQTMQGYEKGQVLENQDHSPIVKLPPGVGQQQPRTTTGSGSEASMQPRTKQSNMGQVAFNRVPGNRLAGQPQEGTSHPQSEQMKTLVKQMTQLVQNQAVLVSAIKKSNQAKPVEDSKLDELNRQIEQLKKDKATAKKEITESLAQIKALKNEVKELTGKNIFLRREEQKWHHNFNELKKKWTSAPRLTAAFKTFKAKWELRGLDPDKAVFISKAGDDIKEVKVGDQLEGLTINKISFSKRRVETNAGTILYQ